MNIQKTSKDVFLAIDANAIVHRAFHAYPSTLQTEDGVQVNAVYGFTVMLLEALKQFHPEYVLCAFDTKAPTFRHIEFAEYKGTRKPTDQSLLDQFPLVEEVLKAFNIPIIKQEGFEADDILGTISKMVDSGKWKDSNLDFYILSGDRDLLQLVKNDIRVCLPSGNFKNLVLYDADEVFKYMGIYPNQIIDYKAIVGDTSDNIPGIKGIGNKTAVDLLKEYGEMDEIYKNLNKLKPRLQVLFGEGIEQAEMSRMLATIEQNMHIDVHLEACRTRDFDRSNVLEIFKRFSFRSLMSKLDDLFGKEDNTSSPQLSIFETNSNSEIEWQSLDTFNNLMEKSQEMVIGYVSKDESYNGEPYYVVRFDFTDGGSQDGLFRDIAIQIPKECVTTFYNWEELTAQKHISLNYDKSLDVLLFAHNISSGRKTLSFKDLAFDYAGKVFEEKLTPLKMTDILDAIVEIKGREIKKANETELYEYTQKSIKEYLKVDGDYLQNVVKKVEMPVSEILGKMERRGIKIDVQYLTKLDSEVKTSLDDLSKGIFDSVGHEFNLNSPKQLADVLFNELQLPLVGKQSTREDVLEGLVGAHPCVEKLLEYREVSKIYGTYTSPLLEMAKNDSNTSIHTDFKQTGTTSGRFSSVNPNMQNLPASGNWSAKLRKAFVPNDGFKFVGMDYAQMELRIMADMSRDDLLIKDFRDGLDIHKATAARILEKDIEDVTKAERGAGKTVNFAILFGQTAFGLSRLLKIDAQKAAEYIQHYFEHYVGVENYIRILEKEAYARGFVQSMLGTTRRIAAVKSRNITARRAALREAVNMPIQGTEADIMKLGMVKLNEMIEREFDNDAYILLQIHDEFVFEVKESRVEEFRDKVCDILRNAASLETSLEVHDSIGNDLSELK
jgi:DNA polymerase-1